MFKSIVVGTDGSETARTAVEQAIELAALSGAKLHVVSAFQQNEPLEAGKTARGRLLEAEKVPSSTGAVYTLLTQIGQLANDAGVEFETSSRVGDPADALLDVAEERDADVIVVGNKGMTGAKRFLLGSVPNKVSHHAPCSVLIIRTT
jgi:nucleotide-binding universal stress UspA family protein